MGQEINLLDKYPKSKRDVSSRGNEKTDNDRMIARKFDKDFFDGDRRHGYGGFEYHPRFWSEVVVDIANRYNLDSNSRVLDVGCAKGFLVYDLSLLLNSTEIRGIDISEYAISHGKEEIKANLQVADARSLPFQDNEFDLVISINTLHNFDGGELDQAFMEVERVSKKNSFITVDAYENEEQKLMMEQWNLTALTIKSTRGWKTYFEKVGYTGDYYWFMP